MPLASSELHGSFCRGFQGNLTQLRQRHLSHTNVAVIKFFLQLLRLPNKFLPPGFLLCFGVIGALFCAIQLGAQTAFGCLGNLSHVVRNVAQRRSIGHHPFPTQFHQPSLGIDQFLHFGGTQLDVAKAQLPVVLNKLL